MMKLTVDIGIKGRDLAFKDQALLLGEEIGERQAAERLGIKEDTLRQWKSRRAKGLRMFKKVNPDAKTLSEAEREIRQLRKENDELKKANEILKAISNFFSKDRPNTNLSRSESSPKKIKR